MHVDPIAEQEPAQARAGDTWRWRRAAIAGHPAADWTLRYRFRHPTLAGFEIAATVAGGQYSVHVPAATTAAYLPGSFAWFAWLAFGADSYTVGTGTLAVLPNMRAGDASGTLDARSDARRIYDDLLTAYRTHVATQGRVQSYTIGTRSMTFTTLGQLLDALNYWRAQVDLEERAARGRAPSANLYVRPRG